MERHSTITTRCFYHSAVFLIAAALLLTSGTASADTPDDAPASPRAVGGDMTFCQLYGLQQFGRVSDIVGLSIFTTAWNIGTADLQWQGAPNEHHPFIAMNLYRLKGDRFEQIGQSWAKHGYFANNATQCGGTCAYEIGHDFGDWLGTGCTDTYNSTENAFQGGLGPRYEVNPWTGAWTYAGSHFTQSDSHTAISHRLQVHDADLNPAQNAGATYYAEAYYVMADDVNVMNSASWKPVTVTGTPGGTWSFTMSNLDVPPNIGFAINAWTGATQKMFAQDNPPVEFVSADGRCILAGKATALPYNFWRYEYALLNIDMDRQVSSLSIPKAFSTTVRNTDFHAPAHHNEAVNAVGGVPINNNPWTATVTSTAITFSTTSNPVRWGTVYNFRFEANVPPVNNAVVTMGLFKSGSPTQLTQATFGPSPNHPDCNSNSIPDYQEGPDCDGDLIPDVCEPNCDNTGLPDTCVISNCPPNTPGCADCNGNGIPDGCDIAGGLDTDCNGNGKPDHCEIAVGSTAPGGPFYCISGCALDCNNNGKPDSCDVTSGLATDCNGNQVLDSCEITANPGLDCNLNGKLDSCGETDCNHNSIPDDCETPSCAGIMAGDMDCSGTIDSADVPGFIQRLIAGLPSCLADMNHDGVVNGRDIQPFVNAATP